MLANEVEALVQNSQSLCQIFLSNPNPDNGLRLEECISKLVYNTSSLDPTARIHVSAVGDFLFYCKQAFISNDSTHSMRSRICLLFFNMAHYNTEIRKFLCGEVQLCDPIFRHMQTLVHEKLGPQNVIDMLRLLQMLTYEKCLSLGSWTNEALVFLIAEILKVDGTEQMDSGRHDSMDHFLPYCLMIFCNLVSKSKMVSNKVKKMGNFKHVCRKLLDFLQNNSRTVVVCSLVLIGYLDEKTRDTIFSPQNISQSLLCIFNVLGCADSLMTIHIAVDLLKRLIVSTPVCGPRTLTSTAKNFTSYQFFDKSIQRTVGLLISMDPRSEEAEAIFDLLLSFCKVKDLRRAVCSAIIHFSLTTSFTAITRTASLSFADAIRPDLPLQALRMLTFLIREATEEGVSICDLIASSTLCSLVESSIKAAIETKSNLVKYQCMRITEGLRLAEAVVNDEEARHDLLDVVNAPLCAHINESQLISNPIVGFMNKLKNALVLKVSSNELPEWSLCGVAIPLQLLRLLATLKDYSKMHKDLYWRSLKDERIVPFISFAISQGDDELVYDAFVLFTHCAQIQEFPTRYLSDLVSACTLELKLARHDDMGMLSTGAQNGTSCESLSDYAYSDVAANSHESLRQLDELLEKMKGGMDLKDVRTSQLICAFEKKVAMHVSRERELEQLIAIKEQALSQSERLRNICQNRDNSEEISNLRMILADLEKKLEESSAQVVTIETEKEEHLAKVAKLKKVLEVERSQRAVEVDQFQREKALLLDDNEKERELQTVLKSRFDEMTAKFDIASKTILMKQKDLEVSASAFREIQQKQEELEKRFENVVRELNTSKSTAEMHLTQIDQQKQEIERLMDENKKLQKIKKAMAEMLND